MNVCVSYIEKIYTYYRCFSYRSLKDDTAAEREKMEGGEEKDYKDVEMPARPVVSA